MADDSIHLSLNIEAVARPLAEWTAGRLSELDEGFEQRCGAAGRAAWVRAVQTQIRYLAQAIATDCPQVFIESVAWSEVAFAEREEQADLLRTALRALRDVVSEHLPEPARSRATEMIDAAIAQQQRQQQEDRASPAAEFLRDLDEPVLRYLEAAISADRPRAAAVVRGAINGSADPRGLYNTLLQPAQVAIGEMWHRGEISVAEEHAATAITESMMAILRERVPVAAAGGRRVVTTGVGGDLHAVGVRMVADFFEFAGWSVTHLGANTPREDVIETAAAQRADVLAVSCTSTLFLRDLMLLIDGVRADERTRAVPVLAGGAPFNRIPELCEKVGADGFAASAPEAVSEAQRLLDSVSSQ